MYLVLKKNDIKTEIKLEIDDNCIKSEKETKFLGMWLDCHLNWNSHLNKLFIKLKRNQAMLRLSKNFLNAQALKMVYYAHLDSHKLPSKWKHFALILWKLHVL